MKYTATHRIIALLLAMMLFVSPLSPAAFAESPELQPDVQTIQTPDEAPTDLADQPEEEVFFEPTAEPAVETTTEPTAEPTAGTATEPTAEPTAETATEPTVEPTAEVTAEPTAEPTTEPTAEPTAEPTVEPTAEPAPEAPVYPTVRDVLAAGGYPYVMSSPLTLYADAELTQPMYTVTSSDAIFMVTSLIERDGLNSMEVWLLNLDYELIVAYASSDALPDTALPDADVQTMAQERLSAMVFAVNGEFIVFVAEGEAVLPDVPPVEENPAPAPMLEDAPVTDAPAMDEPQEAEAPASKQIGEFVLVTPNTRVFMDVDDWASDEYLGDLYVGQFIRDAAAQIVEIKQDSLGRTWYVVDYLYGPDEGDGLICEIIATVHVLADETQDVDAAALTATDVVLPKGYSMPMTLASEDFSLRDNSGGIASFYAGESGLHATTGHDNEYLPLARHDDYGTIFATPHYLKGEVAYCLEHTQNSPVVRDNDSGPYTIVDLAGYRVTPGHSGYIFSDKTMHALAWVLRHSYPFMVLERSDEDNDQWSRSAGQFAMREVIKELEGEYYVREYWDMDEFYRPYDYAPGVYLEYARWLAAEALAYAETLPTITVYDKSVTRSGNQYIGTATLYSSADQIRISKAYGTITGNSAGDDWDYYYLYSGDTISITSQSSTFSLVAEALPSEYDEAAFFVAVTDADIQKLFLPAYGDPYPVAEVSIEFEVPHGAVKVVKKSAQTGALLPGTVFELLNSSGSVVQTQTTGADGSATFANLTPGTYTVREKTAPQGYQLGATNTQNVTVTAGSTSSVTFSNDVMTSKIRIAKTDALTGEALAGAEFTITRLSGAAGVAGVGSVVATLTTGADGTAETGWLPWGRYRIEETSAPEHYVNAGFTTEIDAHEDGKTYTFSVSNESTKGYIQIAKTDSLDQSPLEGVWFDIYQITGDGEIYVDSIMTNADGVAVSGALPKGEYSVRESDTPDGYVREFVELPATVRSDETTYLTATNEPIQGYIQINKTDELTGEPLAGAEFTIYRIGNIVRPKAAAAESEPVAVIVTDENGIATSPLLRWGRYRVVESVVPEHFVDNHFSTEVVIDKEDVPTITVEAENEPTKGYIQLVKTNALDQMPIEGVQFDIYYADEYGDGIAATMTTNKDGVALSEPLRKGVYKVVEHENPTGYVSELNQQPAIVWSDETTHLFASNQPIQGQIQIIKTDELTGEALAGAEFTITRVSGLPSHKGVGDGEVVATIVTDENGIATSPLLTWGTYRVDETKVPEHFVDNHFSTEMVIDEENLKTYTIEVANEPTKGFIRLTKTDRLNGNPIKGVKFEVYYNDQYGEGLATTMVTDADGVAISEPLRKGQYLVREQGATAGYVFEEIELNATVKSDETTELTATNQPVQVQLLIMKRDTEETAQDEEQEVTEEAPLPTTRGDGVLTGAEFQILAGDTIKDRQGNVLYRKDDVVIPSIKTEGEYASAMTPPLWPGLYKAVELTPPVGYHPSEKRITIDARSAAKVSDQAVVIYEGTKTNKIRYGAQAIVKILGANENEVDPERIEVPEADAEFLVYLKKAGSYESAREFERDHLVTNARGYAKTKALPYGVYTLEQIKGKDGYELKGKIDFMITGEEDTYNPPPLTLSDRPILYRLKLTKVDAETGLPIILANTSFKLRDSEGNYVTQTLHYPNEAQIDTYITDDTGSVTLPQTLNWGMYTVEEVHSPTGYLALDEGFSIFVGSAGDTPDNVYEVNVKIPNDPVKGRILVQKKGLQFTGVQAFTDSYGNKVHQPVYEERYLAGATFEVRASDDIVGGDGTIWYRQGDLVDTITTTDAGSDASKELPLGKYVLVETVAPAGYALDDTPHEVELTFMDNQTALVETSVSIRNTYLSAEIALTKEKEVLLTEEENGEVRQVITTAPGEGFVFGLFTDNDLHFDGGAIMAGSLVATGVTDAQGRLTFTGCFPHGYYTIRELSAPDGWTMSKDAYPVVLDPADLDAGESVIRVELDSPIHNALVYYAMTLTKTDITGAQTVPGARLEVSDDDGNIIYRATTDENGEIPDIFVTPGRYTFREIIAPEGYALSEAELTFEVDKGGNVTGNTMIRDDYTRVSVLKQDESSLPMAGVEFSLLDASGNVRMTAISDLNGLATFERIPYGKYTITETKPLPGYFRSDVSVEVTVDGSFVNPTEPLATITNHPMRIDCIKVDNSGRTLPGVEFGLIDARTNTIVEIVTSDEQGRFVFDAIDYGSWIIRETRAPEGYMVMEDVYLEIGEDFVQPEPITFTNIPNHYELMKVDDQYKPLAGVTFALEDENGNVLCELVSGEDGIVHADNLTFGSYVIRETQTLEGYKLTEETISFTIDENYVDPPELYCLVNEREPITAIIQTGVDFVLTPLTWIGAGLALAGAAVMGVYGMSRKRKKRS